MIFQAYVPAFPLSEFIERFFYFEGLSPAHDKERFLPDGNTEIIFDLTENTQFVYDNETLIEIQACRHAWASGVRTRPITIPSGRGSKMLVVAFRKGKAYPFYPMPMREISDQVVGADLIFGRSILDLREQLLGAPSLDRMFLLVEGFLLGRAGGSLPSDSASSCIEYALRRMMDRPDGLCLRSLGDQIGYSQKHFISLFKEQVGVVPKQYLKIMRFQQVIREIENEGTIHWSEIALRSGFYDQAHFINEFKWFSGFTPGEYIKRKSPALNYIPVA